jgi:hypothetical protein
VSGGILRPVDGGNPLTGAVARSGLDEKEDVIPVHPDLQQPSLASLLPLRTAL